MKGKSWTGEGNKKKTTLKAIKRGGNPTKRNRKKDSTKGREKRTIFCDNGIKGAKKKK